MAPDAHAAASPPPRTPPTPAPAPALTAGGVGLHIDDGGVATFVRGGAAVGAAALNGAGVAGGITAASAPGGGVIWTWGGGAVVTAVPVGGREGEWLEVTFVPAEDVDAAAMAKEGAIAEVQVALRPWRWYGGGYVGQPG